MPLRTRLTELLDLSIPLIQAPLAGGGDTAELVATVSNAGALGFIGAAYLAPEQIVERGKAVRALTSRPFGVNLFAPLEAPAADDRSIARALEAIAPYFADLGLPPPAPPRLPAATFEDQLAASLEIGAAAFSFTFGLIPRRAVDEI